MQEEPTIDDIDAELKALEDQLTAEFGEPATSLETPTETPSETPTDVTEEVGAAESEDDLTPAVQSWLARQSPEKRKEVLKSIGMDVADTKSIQKGEEDVAKGAVKQTASQMLGALMSRIPDELIPEGFDDMEPHEQSLLAAEILSEMKAEAKKNEAMAPYEQQRAMQEMQQKISNTATAWSAELGVPQASNAVHQFLSQFPPEDVQRFEQDAQAGGSPFTYMVAQEVKRIVEGFNATSEKETEKPLPNASDVSGTADNEPLLSKDAQVMFDEAKKLGLDDAQLKAMRKELSGVK